MRAADILKGNAELIASGLVNRQLQRRPEEWQKYEEKGIHAAMRDSRYLVDYLYEAVREENPHTI